MKKVTIHTMNGQMQFKLPEEEYNTIRDRFIENKNFCLTEDGVDYLFSAANTVGIASNDYKEDIQEPLITVNGNSEELGCIVVEAINKYHQSFGHAELNI